jgi:spore germination protein KC
VNTAVFGFGGVGAGRIVLLALLLAAGSQLTGCWDRKEANSLGIIMAAGIDKASDDLIEITVQVYNPRADGGSQSGEIKSGGGGSDAIVVRSEVGSTIADAMSKMQEKFSRRIFWGHGELFIISEEVARDGVRSHLDFLIRNPELRDNADIFVSKGPAKQILSKQPALERNASEMLRHLAQLQLGIKSTIIDLAQMLADEAGAAALPMIDLVKPVKNEGNLELIPHMGGTAVFKEDKMIGTLDDSSTRGLMWVRNEVDSSTVTVTPARSERGTVSIKMIRGSTKLIPQIKGGQWMIRVKSYTVGDILQNTTQIDFSDPQLLVELEKDFSEHMKARFEETISTVQKKMKSDVLGFAEAFHRKYPAEWRNAKDGWAERFSQVKVDIDAEVKIQRKGLSGAGTIRPPQEVRYP